jgi:hypothetical protein
MTTVEIILLWYGHKLVAMYFEDRLIWESGRKFQDEDTLIDSRISLPFNEAINFVTIMNNGISTERLKYVFAAVDKRIAELIVLEEKYKELNLDVGADW